MTTKKKGLISFSGGETSAFMLWWLLQNKSDEYDFTIIFANTGRENEATLEFVKKCANQFGCEIIWVEAVIRFKVRYYGRYKIFTSFEEKESFYNSFSEKELDRTELITTGKKSIEKSYRLCIEEVDCGTIHKLANFETATRNQDWKLRNDTPYEMMVKKYGLANIANKISTRELKERPIHSYMKSIGLKRKDYDTFIGIRSDEIDRVSVNRKALGFIYPLVQWKPFTKKHVNFWWSTMPFRLILEGWAGNCVSCYKRALKKLYKIMQDDPWKFEFDEYLETTYGYYIPRTRLIELKLKGKELPDLPIKIFRENKTVKDIREEAKYFKEELVDDSKTTDLQLTMYDDEESCEVFAQCGVDN